MTPRLYLSGYSSSNEPLPPMAMMEDIVGDYKDKTVTLEDFNFVSPPIKTASIHPCRHASVMKILLDRADAALKLRIQKMKNGQEVSSQGMEGLVDQTSGLKLDEQNTDATYRSGLSASWPSGCNVKSSRMWCLSRTCCTFDKATCCLSCHRSVPHV